MIVKIHRKDITLDNKRKRNVILCATHLPLLVRAFTLSEGDVLELGTGWFSTTILRWLCEMSGRTLYSYESSNGWHKRATRNPAPYHKVFYTPDWDKADIDRPWGLAFVDHDSPKRRWMEIKRLANLAEYIVVHDTNPEWDRQYRYHRIWDLFKYKYDFKKYIPWTSVVSNFHNLDSFKLDEQGEAMIGEVDFWNSWFIRNNFKYQGERRLLNLFDFMIGDKKEIKIANLGAGGMNLIGDRRRDVKVKVLSSDFLAREYNEILERKKIDGLPPMEYQDMTKLTYKDEEFDIVYCANALDHCNDPHKALEEMVRVCKPGGWIYLRHHAHEARRLGYHGLHQWNLDQDGEDCRIWNREKSFYLSTIYPGFTTSLKSIRKGSIITSYVQKK